MSLTHGITVIDHAKMRRYGREQAARWHDEREAAMREVYRTATAPSIDKDAVLERANWHRDCAAEIRKMPDTHADR
jgi:hypothetical protein